MGESQAFWSSQTGFILATIGAAVGLGSIWKFPYEVGSNGGGAFILFYFLGLAVIVFPLMLVEFAIGRRGRSDAADAIANVAQDVGASRLWSLIGLMGIITAFLILSFYSVVGGWAIAYADRAIARVQAALHDHPVRGFRREERQSHRPPV
jgi:NSS family neurotransmitter:Na+ symporter